METKRVDRLRQNDWIICPARQHREQITMAPSKRLNGRWFFRTDHHDHHLPGGTTVVMAEPRG